MESSFSPSTQSFNDSLLKALSNKLDDVDLDCDEFIDYDEFLDVIGDVSW